MESWTAPLSPETSSEEEKDRDDNSGTTKRSYECTFCKRGFTNAQALGGHMNIHRKDRAKAKQLSNQYHSNEDYISMSASQFSAPTIYTQPASGYYPVLGHHEHHSQRSYNQMYYQPSESSPRFYGSTDDDSRSSQSHQDIWGANLSLRFSPTRRVDDDDFRMGVRNHEEVDLELRLGH